MTKDQSFARPRKIIRLRNTPGTHIAERLINNLRDRHGTEINPDVIADCRNRVAIHMLRRREYWHRVARGTLKTVLSDNWKYQEDYYAEKYSGIKADWFAKVESYWRVNNGRLARPAGSS